MRGMAKVLTTLALGSLVVGCASWCCTPKKPKPGAMPPEPEHAVVSAIEVEDAVEVALLEQEIGLVPIRLESRTLYYEPDAEVTRRLEQLGYRPKQVEGLQVYRRVMRALGGGDDEIREAGVTVLLREEDHRVVYGTLQQLRVLARLGVRLEEVRQEPRPRQVRVLVRSREDVQKVADAGVDVYTVEPLRTAGQQQPSAAEIYGEDQAGVERDVPSAAFVVYGGAFDVTIDRLRELDYSVDVVSDVPEVVP
jgi:hypothetical protein